MAVIRDMTGRSARGVLRDLPRRVTCPVCKRRFAITPTSGVIRKHYATASMENAQSGERVMCGGSGRQA